MAASQLIPEEVEKIGKAWHFYFRTWWFFHYFIGVAGVVSAITVANNPKFLQAMPFVLDVRGAVQVLGRVEFAHACRPRGGQFREPERILPQPVIARVEPKHMPLGVGTDVGTSAGSAHRLLPPQVRRPGACVVQVFWRLQPGAVSARDPGFAARTRGASGAALRTGR